MEVHGGVLFVNKAYRLIPTTGKEFGQKAIKLMAMTEEGDQIHWV